jgi:hypothetical protein
VPARTELTRIVPSPRSKASASSVELLYGLVNFMLLFFPGFLCVSRMASLGSARLAIDVILGVRECWRRLRNGCCSRGFDSYIKVASESDEFASSTALATFCSNTSALEEAVPALIEGAFRLAGFLSFLGRIVSLLGLRRKLPSTRPEAERSWLLIVACAIEGTVSVSTVMLRRGGSRARVERELSEGLDETLLRRWVEVERYSCILAFGAVLGPLSLPLPVLVLWLTWVGRVLRSSVTLMELTSLRSSSERV